MALPHAQLALNKGLDVVAQPHIELQLVELQVERSINCPHLPHGKRPSTISDASSRTIHLKEHTRAQSIEIGRKVFFAKKKNNSQLNLGHKQTDNF